MIWFACQSGDCSRFEKPTLDRTCPVCRETTGSYVAPPVASARQQSVPVGENARRVAARRQEWSQATGVPLAARADVPYAATLTTSRPSTGASGWNYLWLLLGLVGGIVGNLMVRDDDPVMAKRLLLWSVVGTILAVALTLAL